jgi:S-DNA-T family DNA segregation ATPase FtsK/SpoIIIE
MDYEEAEAAVGAAGGDAVDSSRGGRSHKGGMEFWRGSRLFSGFAYDNDDDTLALLRAATDLMRRRAEWLRGHTRLHAPTFDEPLMVVIIDEIASLHPFPLHREGRSQRARRNGRDLPLAYGR